MPWISDVVFCSSWGRVQFDAQAAVRNEKPAPRRLISRSRVIEKCLLDADLARLRNRARRASGMDVIIHGSSGPFPPFLLDSWVLA